MTTRTICALTLAIAASAAFAQAPAQPAAQPAAAAPAAAAPAGDPAKGRAKTQMCEGCHGIPGWRTAFPEVYSVPKLGGQNPNYIVAALKEYRAGERTHPSMRAVASNLSDEDMANVAAYYSQPSMKTASQK